MRGKETGESYRECPLTQLKKLEKRKMRQLHWGEGKIRKWQG